MLRMYLEEKDFRKKLQSAGADMNVVKNWFRKLEKIKRSSVRVVGRYQEALDALEEMQEILVCLEDMIRGTDPFPEKKREQLVLLRDLKKLEGSFDHPFVISSDDAEFHMIYRAVCKLGSSYRGKDSEKLIFQSEVENLLDLVEEHRKRPHPNLFALCYFYLGREDKDLIKLSPKERLEKVERVCRKEFLEVMQKQAAFYPDQEEAKAAVREFCKLYVL